VDAQYETYTQEDECKRNAHNILLSSDRGSLLFGQSLLKSVLRVRNELLIAGRVDEDTGASFWIALQFGEQVEILAVSSKKYVAR
jgi:hypothetical protein